MVYNYLHIKRADSKTDLELRSKLSITIFRKGSVLLRPLLISRRIFEENTNVWKNICRRGVKGLPQKTCAFSPSGV